MWYEIIIIVKFILKELKFKIVISYGEAVDIHFMFIVYKDGKLIKNT